MTFQDMFFEELFDSFCQCTLGLPRNFNLEGIKGEETARSGRMPSSSTCA